MLFGLKRHHQLELTPLAEPINSKRQHLLCPLADDNGRTMLHRLDALTPLETVRSFLTEYPEAGFQQDLYGRPALYYALKLSCSFDVIKTIFDSCPTSIALTDACGQSGLDLLFQPSMPASIVEYVLEQKPELALHRHNTFSGIKLLTRICKAWEYKGASETESDSDGWRKLRMTIRAAHRATFPDVAMKHTRDLHMAIDLGLSSNLICLFVQLYPEQTWTRMSSGLLPLHHVLLDAKTTGSAIRHLLAVYPEAAAEKYTDERYPLHVAITMKRKWDAGVKEIAYSCHEALHTVDPITGFCPFLAAHESSDLTTIFSLLRERPLVHR
jgi:hypothetical protein